MLQPQQKVIYIGPKWFNGMELTYRSDGALCNNGKFICALSDIDQADLLDPKTRKPMNFNTNTQVATSDSDDMFGGEPGSAYVNQ